MKEWFYKTNGRVDVETGHPPIVVGVKTTDNEKIYLYKDDILFLKKCIDEILEDEE